MTISKLWPAVLAKFPASTLGPAAPRRKHPWGVASVVAPRSKCPWGAARSENFPGQRLRLVGVPIGDEQAGRTAVKERRDDAARGAAGTEQQDALPGQRDAEIDLDVAHQTGAVGVVAENPGFLESQRIDCARPFGTGAAPGAETKSLFLERHGYVRPFATGGDKLRDCRGKPVKRGQYGFVANILSALFSEARMDGRRPGMGNRIAQYAIAVGHFAET